MHPLVSICTASGAMAWSGLRLYGYLTDAHSAVCSLGICCAAMVGVYLTVLILLRGLRAEDVRMLPGGEKLAAVLKLP